MIQRIQTIWLLLAAIAALATLYVDFYYNYTTSPELKNFNAKESILVLVPNVSVAVLSFVNIFLFGNRKLQLRFTVVALIVSLLSIVLCFLSVKSSVSGGLALTAVVYFIIPVFLFLAARGINKDEKLIKSVDRLR